MLSVDGYHGHEAILRNSGMCHYYDPPVKRRLDLLNTVCNGPPYFHLLRDISLLYRRLKLRGYLMKRMACIRLLLMIHKTYHPFQQTNL